MEPEPVQNPEPVTLRFGIPYQFPGEDPLLLAAIEQFEQEHPHLTVEIVSAYYFDGGAVENLQVDVFMGFPDRTLVAGDQPVVLSLEPFITEGEEVDQFDEDDFFPGLLNAFRRQGDLYGMPINLDVAVMYYNRDMFDTQGVAYPQVGWTWQDFLASAHQLTTIEQGEEQQTGQWGFVSHPAFGDLFPFVLQHGGTILDDPLKPTRPIFDDPLAAEAIQWYADLGLVHKVMPIVQRDKIDELSRFPTDTFALQQAAMAIGGVGDRGGDIIPWDFAWGVVPLPCDQAPGSWMLVRGYYIAAQTGYPQEAWTLMRSLAAAETSRVPARRSMVESDVFRQRVGGELADAVLFTLDNGNLWLIFTDTRSLDWYRRFTERAYWVVNGDNTAEEMMDKLQGELTDWSFEDL